ncbi:MAG: protein kinase domain-containing protein, partial [Aggregatilineales bacterium]
MDSGALIEEKYQVIEHIGRGGMADVWSARDQRLRRMVAIKTIAAGLTQDMDPLALFEKEAQTIAGMEHPHILPIYSFGSYEGSLYIAMRYVTGGSLEDTLENGAMNTQEVLRIGKAVGQALDHAHQNNIIHLDLKPGNILLDSNDAPYLADFGLATVLDPEGRAKNPGSGTLLYMAPEQLVSDMIDYRADIYSFCIMLYHMFTGQLPFEGTVPLAMKQLQNGQNLPEVSDINPDLHDGLTEILRLGTAQDATLRPDTHADVMDQLQDLFTPITVAGMIDPGMSPTDTGMDMIEISVEQERLAEFEDADLLEAVDIYTRARRAWAGGHGRFVPGLTHFMIVSDYYMQADYYHLSIDDSGYQLLLRGALEYNYELDYWWGQLHNQDAQRRVCLHTLRSGTAPARIRALKRLEYLPDDETSPVIPRLISQALEVEGDDSARIAALNTLRIRAKSIQRYQFENTPKVKPDENTMLDSVASQMGIQLAPPSEWQEVVYSDEVDELIAETALDDDGSDQVTEFAARTVGQIHSLAGVRHIANAAREKRRGALEALALVRDETTSLPDEVDRQARLYAWLMNTLRRMIDRPLDGILRFVLVLLGAWVGMGEVIYVTFNSSTLFSPQRWMYTIAVGIVFGLFVALTLMVTDELSRRLSGFWRWWMRLLISGMAGLFMGIMTWSAFTWLFLWIEPEWYAMRLAGVA